MCEDFHLSISENHSPRTRTRINSAGSSCDVLDVDVGGTVFRTGAATLRKAPFFEALLRHVEDGTMDTSTTSAGLLFVDRSPKLFPHVLEFLRSGLAFAASPHEEACLRAEFSFFGLDPDAIAPAPGTQSEEALLSMRWKHVDMSSGDKTYIFLSIHAPTTVLEVLRQELSPNEMGLEWEQAEGVLCAEIVRDEASSYSDLSKLCARPLAKLWRLDFRESGRAESSSLGYDSNDDVRVHWISETVTLRRHF